MSIWILEEYDKGRLHPDVDVVSLHSARAHLCPGTRSAKDDRDAGIYVRTAKDSDPELLRI